MKLQAVQAAPTSRNYHPSWVAFAVSSLIHAGFLLHYTASYEGKPAPLGHWVEMVPGGAPTKTHAHTAAAKAPSALNLPTEKKETVATPEPHAGLGNTTQATGLSGPIGDLNGAQVGARERYLYELQAFLNQRKTYPARARLLGQSGLVEVAFHVHGDGSITDPHVVRPCIHDLLNRSALELVASVGRFQPLPVELGLSVLHVTVPIQYELN